MVLILPMVVLAAAAGSRSGWCLVTGASSGIGAAFAREAAQCGYDVVLTSRREGKLQQLAQELTCTYGVQTLVVPADITADTGTRSLYERTAKLDVKVLIANAGEAFSGEFISQPTGSLERLLQLNVCATTRLCHHYAAKMAQTSSASKRYILLTGSVTACTLGLPGGALYAATKAMQRSLAAGLRTELRPCGVSVTCVLPGATDTEFAQQAGMQKSLVFSMPCGRRLGVVLDPNIVARRGLAAAHAGKGEVVPGMLYKAFAVLAKVAPAPVARRVGAAFYSG